MDEHERPRERVSHQILIVVFILGVSAFLHAIFLHQFQKTPYAELLMVDADIYHAKALGILANGWFGPVSSYQAPLYPYLLALIYSLFGVNPLNVQIFQCCFSVANVLVIYFIGVLYLDLGSNDLARAEFLEALKINPHHAEAMQNMDVLKSQ